MTQTKTPTDRSLARKVLQTEAAAILALIDRLDENFDRAVRMLYECQGRVIVTGMGKSGIICRKIAATLASTGTSAFFLHPAEATHGDLGVIQPNDLLLAISHSGETQEVLRLLEAIRRIGARIVAITGNPASTLAQAADVALDCQVSEEACPLNLVPTASTTAALAMGDALCMTLLVEKGFREEDFAKIHPGGKLGKKLMRVDQLMHGGADAPIVRTDTPMRDVIYEISSKTLGMTCVVNAADELVGIITDGDLRRSMVDNPRLLEMTAGDVMTRRPIVIDPSTLAAQALLIMEQRKITSLVVGGKDQTRRRRASPPRPLADRAVLSAYYPFLAALDRASHRADGREGVGALQAASRAADRSPPRPGVAPLHRRPELPRHQPDRSRDRRAEQGRRESRRRARNSPAARQSVSREGAGRARHQHSSEPAAAAAADAPRTGAHPAVPRSRLQARRIRRSRARSVQRSASGSIRTTSTRC